MGMNLFAQLTKVDEEKRLVYARAAQEVVDKSGEIMDYEGSKPNFKAWSAEFSKDTDGKSLGNVRAMHGKISVGKLTKIDFNDEEKAIDVCLKVIDNNEWQKVLEGCYRGLSIGGSYGAKTVEKINNRDITRYVALPNEVSLVDSPCIPTAKFFEVQKSDGSLAKIDFKETEIITTDNLSKVDDVVEDETVIAKTETVEDVEVVGTPDEIIAFGKLMNDEKLSMAQVIEMVKASKEKVESVIVEKLSVGELRKSLYCCAEFAQLIQSLQYLVSSAQYEAFSEGDDSDVPKKLAACLALCGSVLQDMVAEEVGELGTGIDVSWMPMELSEKIGSLAKYEGDPLITLIKVGARNSSTDKTQINAIHKAAVELGADCADVDKSESSEDLQKAHTETLSKAIADAMEPLNKALSEANDKITKLEAQPAAPRVSLRAVSKAEDNGVSVKEPSESDLIKDDHGIIHPAASLIKQALNNGGQPLHYRG